MITVKWKFIFSSLILAVLFLSGCQRQPTPEAAAPKILPQEAKVLILTYHQIREITPEDGPKNREFTTNPKQFESEMEKLKAEGFETINFWELNEYFKGNFNLPQKALIISFDDGTAGQYQNAFPLLKKYGFKATFFVFSNALGRNERYMTWDQLKEMADAGMEVGSHGYYHLYFDDIEGEELEREIFGSKAMIEKNIGRPIYVISYPFGSKSEEVLKMVKDAGYIAGRGIVNGTQVKREDLYQLKGYFMTSDSGRINWILK